MEWVSRTKMVDNILYAFFAIARTCRLHGYARPLRIPKRKLGIKDQVVVLCDDDLVNMRVLR